MEAYKTRKDVKNLTSNFEECQNCGKLFLPFPLNTASKSQYYCNECFVDLQAVERKLKAAGVLCCGITNPGPRGEQGEPGDIKDYR